MSTAAIEVSFPVAEEVRFAVDEAGSFGGYASVWDQADSFGDTIRKGAFSKSLKRQRPAMLWAHDTAAPIGIWSEIVEDERGLKVTGKLVTETRMGAEALALLKAGAVTGLSIGFRTVRSERGANGGRIVVEVELMEVSLVVFPAQLKARVTTVKSANPASLAAFTEAVRRAAVAAAKGRLK